LLVHVCRLGLRRIALVDGFWVSSSNTRLNELVARLFHFPYIRLVHIAQTRVASTATVNIATVGVAIASGVAGDDPGGGGHP
jgi:hypothetical protein